MAVNNRLTVTVDNGPAAARGGNINIAYADIRVCSASTGGGCVTIPDLQVDTGSVGIRIFASVLTTAGISLPAMGDAANAGNTIAECTVFADGYVWGPVTTATVQMAGETATDLPIQIIDDSSPRSFASAPSVCTNQTSGAALNTVAKFYANGVLGIGVFPQDCGGRCEARINNNTYYSCTAGASGTCASTALAATAQVNNPISFFATDNNGSVLSLESIVPSGQSAVSGSLTFGIGTTTNNALPSTAVVLPLDNSGTFSTTGSFLSQAQAGFFDSGSNAYFFDDTGLRACTRATGFYCPTSTTLFSVTNQGRDANEAAVGNSTPFSFSIANFETVTANSAYAYNDVGGGAGDDLSGDFDFGLPFYYGRSVFTGIYGASAIGVSGLTGPYFAYATPNQ